MAKPTLQERLAKEARRAARHRGYNVLPGVAINWREAMRRLGCTRKDNDETDAKP